MMPVTFIERIFRFVTVSALGCHLLAGCLLFSGTAAAVHAELIFGAMAPI